MQIIQSIREKGAAIVIAVIALSLIGFILMDAQQGGSRLFGGLSNTVGSINGEDIDLQYFTKRVRESEDMQFQRTGQKPTGTQTYQMRDQAWNQIVAERVFFAETNKLGLQFTAKELSGILMSEDPNNPFLQEQSLKDSITGKLDIKKVQKAIANIKKLEGEQRENVNAQIFDPLKLNTTVSKYSALLNASAYYPSWMEKRDNEEARSFSVISYVGFPFSDITDSTIKVTDEEVKAYIKENKDQFKQEKGRKISYVSIGQQPSGQDTAQVRDALVALIPAFLADTNARAFVARNTSATEFTDTYAPKNKLNDRNADTLAKLPTNQVFGPYLDGPKLTLAKKLGSKEMPDSAKARHILISLNDASGQPKLSDEAAKKLADSVYAAVAGGSDFTALAAQFSADPGSKDKGGDLGTFGYGTMVPEFNDFCFEKTPGSKGVVKTQFGYHIIDLISQKDFKTAYKLAYVSREISPSDVTLNKASLLATKTSALKSKKELDQFALDNKLSLMPAGAPLKENDFSVGALQDARVLVRWAYEAKKGAISEPFSIGDQFIVAVLDEVLEEGTQDVATARPSCESKIRNRKKAQQIIKNAGTPASLEALATAQKKTVQIAGADSSITMNAQFINGVGMEPRVIGASFNKNYQSTVSPGIEGNTGVFFIKTTSVQQKPAETPEALAQQKTTKLNNIRSQTGNWYEGLRKQADIQDKRSQHF